MRYPYNLYTINKLFVYPSSGQYKLSTMKHLLTFTLLVISIGTNCQDLKPKKNRIGMGLTKNYYVLKSDKKMKVGECVVTFREDSITFGQYENGAKSGVWTYLDRESNPEFKYDFKSKMVVDWSCQPKHQRCRNEGSAAYYSLGLMAAYADIASKLKFPEAAAENGYSGSPVVIFIISPKGEIKERQVGITCGNYDIDNAALEAAKNACEENWIPAYDMNGEPVSDTIAFKLNFANVK